MAGIQLTPADKYFSLCVRERVENRCEVCGSPNGVQCCHYESRGNWATRFLGDQCFCMCYAHHIYMDGHKFEFADFFKDRRGADVYDISKIIARDLMLGKLIKKTKGKGAIAKFYENEYERMLEKRTGGILGWIDFDNWVP